MRLLACQIALAAALGVAPAARAATEAHPPATVDCLRCHRAQAEPLAKSRHGLASGPGLWGQLPDHGPNLGSALACLPCHAPAHDQQPWVSGAAAAAPRPGQTAMEARLAALGSAHDVHANPAHDPHATALGVSCTACHLQGGAIVGSRAREPGPGMPHAVAAEPALSSPEACAGCHQFGAAAAVSGKPLENVVEEWRASPWGKAGATCQSCHMPDGLHLFQGIHTPSLVAASVEVAWEEDGSGQGALTLTNSAVGHAFPSYTTPRVVLRVQAEDSRGRAIGPAVERELSRRVRYAEGRWIEEADTRVLPGAVARLAYHLATTGDARTLHAEVRVQPDFGYLVIYRGLLAQSDLPRNRRTMLQEALARAASSGYVIFDERRAVVPSKGQAGRQSATP